MVIHYVVMLCDDITCYVVVALCLWYVIVLCCNVGGMVLTDDGMLW